MHALCITALSPNKYLALEVRNRARHASVAGRAACAPARSCNRMTTPMRNVLANLSCGRRIPSKCPSTWQIISS